MKTFKQFIQEAANDFGDVFWDTYSEQAGIICSEIIRGIKENREFEQSWVVVPKSKIEAVYSEYSKNGYQFFRAYKPMDAVIERCMVNLARLHVNTELAGHTQNSPLSVFDEEDIEESGITEEQIYDFNETYLHSTIDGQYRISDYGLDKQAKFLKECFATDDYTKKFIALDQFLNVIHMRSDLAGWYIEGGSATLTSISGYIHDDESEGY